MGISNTFKLVSFGTLRIRKNILTGKCEDRVLHLEHAELRSDTDRLIMFVIVALLKE